MRAIAVPLARWRQYKRNIRSKKLNHHLLFVGGEDHHLRIPFMERLRDLGFGVSSAASCARAPFEKAGFPFYPFQFQRFISPSADRQAIAGLRAVIARVRPAVVQSFDTKPNLLAPLAVRTFNDLAMIRTINGLGWLYSSRSAAAIGLRPIYRILHRFAARSTTATIFQNRDDQQFFKTGRMLGSGPSVLIPGSGVDLALFDTAIANGPTAAQLRDQLSLGSAPVVLTVTRLTRQKGIPALLAAAAMVHQRRPDVRFLLVGPRESEGTQAISQKELDRHSAYLTATGGRPDIPSLLAMADVFAFPTEYREGVPRVLLEASLAGLPIVTTNMPGCTDVITDGWNGRVVPPRSPSELAAGILELLGDLDRGRLLGQRAKTFVAQNFGLERTVDQYASFYRDVLARGSRPAAWSRPAPDAAPAGLRAARKPNDFRESSEI